MFRQVLYTEFLKLRRTRVPFLSWLAFSVGPLAGGLFMVVLKDPERALRLGLIGQKARIAGGSADWPSLLTFLTQMTAVAGMLLLAVITAYVFGREYAEGTAKDMLTLPVRRDRFAVAKFVVIAVWFLALTAAILAEGFVVGAVVGLPGLTPAVALKGVVDLAFAATVLLLLVPPVAWIAVLGRGYLPPLGFAIMMLVLGNIFATLGRGELFPWSIVALWAGIGGPEQQHLPPASFVLVALTFLIGALGTMRRLRDADNTQ